MDTADVIILGGGLVGLTLASALDAHGLTSIVVDPADPAAQAAPGFDGRASAVASASWRMLQAIGVADRLAEQGCPIRTIRVTDGLVGGLAFDADPADGPLGIMFENRVLRAALRAAAVEAGGVTLLQPARPVATVRDAAGVSCLRRC
jgi:2-octaprenyl-6-methoxyphenol hydroxylase